MNAQIFHALTIALLIAPAACGGGDSFAEQSITADNGDHAHVGRQPAKTTASHENKGILYDNEDILSGSYNGTTFSITLVRENFPGMCSFPRGIHYGESSRYVWIYTHNRSTDGTTLIDVASGEGVFGAYGHGSDVSPDGKRIAYTINGHYGLFHQACVQDYAVYPAVGQLTGTGDIMAFSRRATYPDAPQMEIRYHPEWLDNHTMCFVHYDNPRLADLLRDPDIRTQWFVQVDGVGDGFTTNSIKVRRAELNQAEMNLLDEIERQFEQDPSRNIYWPYEKLAQSCKERLEPVTPDSFTLGPLSSSKFPLLPNGLPKSMKSPDGQHVLTIRLGGEHTDTDSAIEVHFDNILLKLEKPIWPINRLLTVPRWISNDKAEMVLQTNWYDKMLYGKGEPKHWLVTVGLDEGSTEPQLWTKPISAKEATK